MANLLLPSFPTPANEPPPAPAAQQPMGGAQPAAGGAPVPGSRAHMQAQASELGLAKYGTKAALWERISGKQAGNVGRRVRAPREAAAQAETGAAPLTPPMADTPENRLLPAGMLGQAPEAPAAAPAPAPAYGASGAALGGVDTGAVPIDPFTDALAKFEAFHQEEKGGAV